MIMTRMTLTLLIAMTDMRKKESCNSDYDNDCDNDFNNSSEDGDSYNNKTTYANDNSIAENIKKIVTKMKI